MILVTVKKNNFDKDMKKKTLCNSYVVLNYEQWICIPTSCSLVATIENGPCIRKGLTHLR